MADTEDEPDAPTRVSDLDPPTEPDPPEELGYATIDDIDGPPTTVGVPISGVRTRTPEEEDADAFEPPTRVEPMRHEAEETSIDTAVPEPNEATVEVDPSIEGVTTRASAPPSASTLPPTEIKPIVGTTQGDDFFDRPTIGVMRDPAAVGASSEAAVAVEPTPEPAEAPTAPRRGGGGSRPLLLTVAVAVTMMVSAFVGWGIWTLSVGTPEGDGPVATAEPAAAEPAAPDAEDEPAIDPLPEAPPLPEAANLVVTGRFQEAARAYAALAREHPDRPELATMARILRQKARR